MTDPNIYSYVKSEENKYETDEIQLGDNWHWNMRDHVQLIFHLKNGIFYTGENDWMRSFKNIMSPILNLAYWTEDLEVKDVQFFIESERGKALSFLIKKYHDEVYTKEHDLDELFDEITESDIDYGGVLVQKGIERPQIIPFNSIAFCDQTDIANSPIGFKSNYSPSKLLSMGKYGWGDPANGATVTLEDLVTLADSKKDPMGTRSTEKENESSGKNIEIYIVRGDMPEHYLEDNDNMEKSVKQIHIIGFYQNEKGEQEGVTLYRRADHEELLFHTSQPVFGRALGRGTGEALLHDQIWTNFMSIHKTQMLEAGAKSPLVSDDPEFKTRNNTEDFDNNEVWEIEEGRRVDRVPTLPTENAQMFEQEIEAWLAHAQLEGSAFDPILGKEANSGTTFRGQERTVAQGRGAHDRRRGRRAKFIENIYRMWIIPEIVKELTKGKEFYANLSTSEMSWLSDRIVQNKVTDKLKEKLLKGEAVSLADEAQLKEMYKSDFLKTGNKQMLEVLKDEFKGIEVKMGINIAGKQKNLADLSDKVLSIFQFVFQNPQQFQQSMQNPALAEAFSDILEFSGLSIGDFHTLMETPQIQQQAVEQGQPQQGEGLDSLRKQEEQVA